MKPMTSWLFSPFKRREDELLQGEGREIITTWMKYWNYIYNYNDHYKHNYNYNYNNNI